MSDDHDITSDLDFAMLTTPTRPGPCKAATALETDSVEARLEREVQAAPFIFEATKEIIAKRMEGSVVLTHAEARHV